MNQGSKCRDAIYRVHLGVHGTGPGRDLSRPYIRTSFLKVHYHAHLDIGQQKGGYLSIYHAFAQRSRFHLGGGQCITSSHKPPSVSPNGRPEPLREALNGLEDQLASNRRRGICSTLSDKKISGNREGMLALSPQVIPNFSRYSLLYSIRLIAALTIRISS